MVCLIAGCGASYRGTVNSMVAVQNPPGHKYFLREPKSLNLNPLEYQEFSQSLQAALSKSGFIKVIDEKNANFNLIFGYAVGETRNDLHSYSVPVWGKTGISSSTTTGSINTYSNFSNYNATTTYNPSYGITGYVPQVETVTTHNRVLIVIATDSHNKVLWQATVQSRGYSEDMRLLFPVLIKALKPYVWKNTPYAIEFNISPLEMALSD